MKKEKIKVLMIEPKVAPVITYLKPTMKAFQKAVHVGTMIKGSVEAKKVGKDVYAVFHADRWFADLEPNRRIGNDIIAGVMYIVATDKQGFPVSLTDKQIRRYSIYIEDIEDFDTIEVVEANIDAIFAKLWKNA